MKFTEVTNDSPAWVQYLYIKYGLMPDQIGYQGHEYATEREMVQSIDTRMSEAKVRQREDWSFDRARVFAKKFQIPVIFKIPE